MRRWLTTFILAARRRLSGKASRVAAIRRLADEGNQDSQTRHGEMYGQGIDVPKNYAEAAGWFRKAADQGQVTAQELLGLHYHVGLGVTQDYVQAYMWWTLVAAAGRSIATKVRDVHLAPKMTPAQIKKAEALAAAWKPTMGQ